MYRANTNIERSKLQGRRSNHWVEKVEQVTFSGARALEQGHYVLYVTERCMIRLEAGGLVAASHGRVRLVENAVVMPLSLLAEGRMELAL